ncbi:hypothetical protein Q4485_01630 [Granulosicoccaceae sp. 1_MG-2023]|nr:hypothetical protein [Granulosicoccaceae sp. 1_MG-2023]
MSVQSVVKQARSAASAELSVTLRSPEGELHFSSVAAQDADAMDTVQTLRYRAYRAEGYIPENATKRFFDEYDFVPVNRSFLTYCEGRLIGSVRACVSSPEHGEHLPATEIYESEIAREVGFDKTIVESNKFVFEPGFRQSGGLAARLILVRNVLNYAMEIDADVIITAVRRSHARIYKSFGFRPISQARRYPLLDFDTILMSCEDLTAADQYIGAKLGS